MHEVYFDFVEAAGLCFDLPPDPAHASPPALALVYSSNG